ncbi:MAG: hypothetical protein WC313_06990 [Candidatus Kapaibacterium sp.]
MKKIILIIIVSMITLSEGYSRAQYSLLQSYGTKCTGCHINTQGAGVRSFQGWMSRNQSSLIDPSDIGLQGLFDLTQESNQIIEDKLLYGFDFRYQTARWGAQAGASERKHMVMQWSNYLVYTPTDWLTFEGLYNFGYDIHESMRYPGQQPAAGSVIITPSEDLPSVRVGYFQPTIGTRYEDHTMLNRMFASGSRGVPVVPADYAELGVQIDYEAIPWLGLSLGFFSSENLSKLRIPMGTTSTGAPVNGNHLSTVFRAMFFPPEIMPGVNIFAGGTLLMNSPLKTDNGIYFGNEFYYVGNVFFNIGLVDKIGLMTEYMRTVKQSLLEVNNISLELNYQLHESVIPYFRYEIGNTNYTADNAEFQTSHYVFGAKAYILPYIAFLPEYRINDKEHMPGYASQWAFQVHVFY